MSAKNHILFVDDERYFLDGLRRMLLDYFDIWEIDFVEGADQAWEMITRKNYDIVITDVKMPGRSGFDLLSQIKETKRYAALPVVILTGNAEFTLKRKALNLGATDLLNKPVHLEDLVARIHSVLRLKQYQDELKNQNVILEQRVKERTAELNYIHKDIVWRLAKAGELRDEQTGDHVIRVANFSRILAERMSLSPDSIEILFLTSPLHDLGKIGIRDSILMKPGKLDAEEWTIMKLHCEIGASILLENPKGMSAFLDVHGAGDVEIFQSRIDPLRQAAAVIASSHHEKWDGSGYPKGLAGRDIPLFGRIVALADVYDALRSDRPYKKRFSAEKSIDIIREGKGKHFAPDVCEAFFASLEEFEAIITAYSD